MLGSVAEPFKFIQCVSGGFSGCRAYRVSFPANIVNWKEGINNYMLETPMALLDHSILCQTKTILLKSLSGRGGLELAKQLCAIRNKYGIRLVVDYDDLPFSINGEHGPSFNPFAGKPIDPEDDKATRELITYMDCIIVTNEPFKQLMERECGVDNVVVIPNCVSRSLWSKPRRKPLEKDIVKPTILSSGCPLHFMAAHKDENGNDVPMNPGDWASAEWAEWIIDGVNGGKFNYIQMGGPNPLLEPINNKIQIMPWVPPYEFPSLVCRLDTDFVIAPLVPSTFSICKSDLRYIESAVCSNVLFGSVFENSPYLVAPELSQIPQGFTKGQLQDRLEYCCQKDVYNKLIDDGWNHLVRYDRIAESERAINKYMMALTGGARNNVTWNLI